MVGSGAFKLFEWISRAAPRGGAQSLLLRKGLPKLDAVVEMMGVNEELEWLKYEAGEDRRLNDNSARVPARHEKPALKALTIKT